MKKFIELLDERFEEVIGVFLLSIVIILLFIGVILRLLFNSGMPVQEELARILYVIMVFMGSSYGMAKNDHIRVTFVYNFLNDRGKRIMRVIVYIQPRASGVRVRTAGRQMGRRCKQFIRIS